MEKVFVSMSAGFYCSDDLICWSWHENRNLDIYRYAPDVRQIGDYLYFCGICPNYKGYTRRILSVCLVFYHNSQFLYNFFQTAK